MKSIALVFRGMHALAASWKWPIFAITALHKLQLMAEYAASLSIAIGLVNLFFPSAIPYHFFDAWRANGTFLSALQCSWIIFAWGIGFTFLVAIFTRNTSKENIGAEEFLEKHFADSLVAGITEEIIFRWLMFYWYIAVAQLSNWFFFDALFGFGFTEWFTINLFGPVSNFLTFGYLSEYLTHPELWFVAAAMITSNGKFRNGHTYLGLIGCANSWFMGMFFFYIMLNYGLFAAIVIHFLYDLFIGAVIYIDRIIERSQGV